MVSMVDVSAIGEVGTRVELKNVCLTGRVMTVRYKDCSHRERS